MGQARGIGPPRPGQMTVVEDMVVERIKHEVHQVRHHRFAAFLLDHFGGAVVGVGVVFQQDFTHQPHARLAPSVTSGIWSNARIMANMVMSKRIALPETIAFCSAPPIRPPVFGRCPARICRAGPSMQQPHQRVAVIAGHDRSAQHPSR